MFRRTLGHPARAHGDLGYPIDQVAWAFAQLDPLLFSPESPSDWWIESLLRDLKPFPVVVEDGEEFVEVFGGEVAGGGQLFGDLDHLQTADHHVGVDPAATVEA